MTEFSFNNSSGRNLRATVCFSVRSSARYTSPIPPRPSRSITRYRSPRISPGTKRAPSSESNEDVDMCRPEDLAGVPCAGNRLVAANASSMGSLQEGHTETSPVTTLEHAGHALTPESYYGVCLAATEFDVSVPDQAPEPLDATFAKLRDRT